MQNQKESRIKKLFLLDWDGSVNGVGGPGEPWDLEGMMELKNKIQEARRKSPEWGFALATGRGDDYGYAAIESLGFKETNPEVWSFFENGGIFRKHKNWEMKYHPLITEEVLRALELFDKEIMPALFALGGQKEDKKICRTIATPAGKTIEEFFEEAKKIFEAQDQASPIVFQDLFEIGYGASAVDFVAAGLGKRAGATYLSELNKVPLPNMVAIGDSTADLAMFAVTGNSGAPANAKDNVKEKAKVVARDKWPYGIMEIIDYYVFNKGKGVIVN